MPLRLKPLHEQTIVITGATTGIGLATARMAADHGARLVVAARDEASLIRLADETRRRGSDTLHVVVDVGEEEQVAQLADAAIERFGAFDTWVNNAGVSLYGHLLDVPTKDFRRLFDTNFWGVVYGSREAARHLRKRHDGYGGAIINLGSLVSDRAIPLQGMYSASKQAVRGFTDALRMELEEARAPVAVTLVKPGSIATPFPQHAQNYLDEEPTLPPPLYDPGVVARSILHCAEVPRRDIYVGGGGRLLSVLGQYAPRLTDKMMEKTLFNRQKTGRPEYRQRFALHGPATDNRERGDHTAHVANSSLYTEASMHPLVTATVVASAALGIAALARWASSTRPSSH